MLSGTKKRADCLKFNSEIGTLFCVRLQQFVRFFSNLL
ncbi:hypothetical protein BPUTSESOX_676 [uncultured Gammaproteobacteria bacterium]|nr:hypothetical protein BPUTSESOX_676 [uncultured Gammaproteobacteria bacterium]